MAELTAMVPLGGREIEMRNPSAGAVVVLSKIFRRTGKIENAAEMTDEERERAVRNIGVLGDVIDSMIVKEDDRDWLEAALIEGEVEPGDAFAAIRIAGEKLNQEAAPAKAPAPVRRARAGRTR
jgi:hypothetical protein